MNALVFFDEIFLKGGNRPYFLRVLSENISALLPGVAVERVEGGFILRNLGENKYDRLANIPGIAKYARVYLCGNSVNEIVKEISEIQFSRKILTFRVTASRSDKNYALTSDELNRQIGDFLRQSRQWKVDLVNFDLDLHVDITSNSARIFERMQDGVGGLPTGTTGKVMCLISGGIDSPVAAYMAMKRGAEIVLIHFQNQNQVTDEVSQKIIDLGRALSRFQPKVELVMVPYAPIQQELIKNIPAQYRMIVNRRTMLKIAGKIAVKKGCLALVTGDSLGQVASQTLENISCVYEAAKLVVLAPLIGLNKSEITKIARSIGTFDISSRPYEDCCSLFVAKHPETKAKLSDVKSFEKSLKKTALDKVKPISYYLSQD